MRFKFFLVVLACGLLVSCATNATGVSPTPSPSASVLLTATPGISPEASVYLEEALDIMQEHSINRSSIDWDTFRAKVYDQASDARTPADTYDAIRFALALLGDRHSVFWTPTQVSQWQDGTLNAFNPSPEGRLLESRLGYVSLPGFVGGDEASTEYATTVQQLIRQLDSQSPCGWIVDLRQDIGGNMWPMLAGIGPILGEGRVGMFVTPGGQQTSWYYEDGQARLEKAVLAQANGPAYHLASASPPVAVLTGSSTASSGEAIVVAFRGRPNARSFGEATNGRSTGNSTFVLSDGVWILLTISTFADRTGTIYGDKIPPDELVAEAQEDSDPIIQAAVEWLLSQPACDAGKE